MKELAAKISGAELEVMEVLWQADGPLPIAPIRRQLVEQRGWDPSTVKTLLRRLCEKGEVAAEKGQVVHYRPLITRGEYRDWSTHNLIDRVYQGSARALAAFLVRGDQLTAEDLKELEAMLEGERDRG